LASGGPLRGTDARKEAEHPHYLEDNIDVDNTFKQGGHLNVAGINYQTRRAVAALKRLQQLENNAPPRN
jgi:hypothetical protein